MGLAAVGLGRNAVHATGSRTALKRTPAPSDPRVVRRPGIHRELVLNAVLIAVRSRRHATSAIPPFESPGAEHEPQAQLAEQRRRRVLFQRGCKILASTASARSDPASSFTLNERAVVSHHVRVPGEGAGRLLPRRLARDDGRFRDLGVWLFDDLGGRHVHAPHDVVSWCLSFQWCESETFGPRISNSRKDARGCGTGATATAARNTHPSGCRPHAGVRPRVRTSEISKGEPRDLGGAPLPPTFTLARAVRCRPVSSA